MCRKRPFATFGRWRLQTRAAVCRIQCLILCLADVERVGQCRAPNSPVGLNGRIASVIASLFSRARPPLPARASYLEHLILPTATATRSEKSRRGCFASDARRWPWRSVSRSRPASRSGAGRDGSLCDSSLETHPLGYSIGDLMAGRSPSCSCRSEKTRSRSTPIFT